MDSDFRPGQKPAKSVATPKKLSVAKTETPTSDTFQTPEAVAAVEAIERPEVEHEPNTSQPAYHKDKKSWRERLKPHWPFRRREWLISAAIVLICGGIIGFALTHIGKKSDVSATVPRPSVHKTIAKAPPTSTLTGLPISDPAINQRPVTGVMIENSVEARPQAGLGQAGVVFEAIAEGGITRFLALYQDSAPANVGPIRSSRPYYLQWALGFDASYAHVGGSPEALADIKSWGVHDLDQTYNGGSFQRISARAAPHNVYTSIAALNQLETAKGYNTSTYTGFTRKKEAPSKQPTAKTINMAISGPTYNVHYDYNPATNSYNRSEGGTPHIDANTNTQISPKVVIALVMPYSLESDGYHSDYTTIGSGKAYVFQDGVTTEGQWAKSASTSQFTFTDAAGKTIPLNPGQTWLTAVGAATDVTSAP